MRLYFWLLWSTDFSKCKIFICFFTIRSLYFGQVNFVELALSSKWPTAFFHRCFVRRCQKVKNHWGDQLEKFQILTNQFFCARLFVKYVCPSVYLWLLASDVTLLPRIFYLQILLENVEKNVNSFKNWCQSYDSDLQRQRCKKLKRHE
jgi:hypothetical protein